ncbi:NAD(P)-dependent alcohol dehydrogenase [Flagellimonas algicola]|uniref:NAD(P)-dependent alcohol dehydrogenase n=1 Tax=Flagellimonas algicola TaxID=2583815 RepID=A0ABY2WN60_9FLAO|nr:NAD(P)-dependent alcohol dehydrogenase [Allomuricauda algicola]TMU56433.1 NAD(P)-dependent alcohol dehydrogenase [Allomuricauda algicola]
MKAIVQTSYGHPEKVLQLQEVQTPLPKANEVQINIKVTTINDYDWAVATGKPHLYRLMFGLFKPKKSIPGMELAGVVSNVGEQVKDFKIGDKVFGDISEHNFGSFAEYICLSPEAIRKMPANMDFGQAAAIPHAALLALQAFDKVNLEEGRKVLINGGGGGVGTHGLQLAKLKNCEVTGVDSGEKLEAMLKLGFDHVLDYQEENFTKTGIQYDIILDCKTNQSAFAYRRALNPKGKYISIGGKLNRLVQLLIVGGILSKLSQRKYQILALKANLGLERIAELYVQNKLKPTIDGPYSLEDIPRLVQYFGEGKHKGKIVIDLDESRPS